MVCYTSMTSAIGDITLLWQRNPELSIKRLILPNEHDKIAWRQCQSDTNRIVNKLINAIRDYIGGGKKRLPIDLLDWSVCTVFQEQVLKKEWLIPYGKVISYQDLAIRVRDRHCCRAVGSALSRNPFPIIIPCHRTVCADGRLGGYRGGLKLKSRLLKLERIKFDRNNRISKEFFWK